MPYTHDQAQAKYDNAEPNEGQEEEMEMEYFCSTAIVTGFTWFNEFYNTLKDHGMHNEFDWEDWLNEKTHFKYNKQEKHWESHTLDLISEGEG